jgi:uncharacterized protein (DUF2252 family)
MTPARLRTVAERREAGRQLRRVVPRGAHADWSLPAGRRDPVDTLADQATTRVASLIPVRNHRMAAGPLAFLRGAAAVMAADLAHTPATGLRVQACGDCHLANFGAFPSPEGNPVFDINDFDETLPAPFEWDVKRLATSLVLAGRQAGLGGRACRALAARMAAAYRGHMAALCAMPPLAAWRSRIDLPAAIAEIDDRRTRRQAEQRLAAAMDGADRGYGLLEPTETGWRIRERPGLVWHISAGELNAHKMFAHYLQTLDEDRRILLGRYALHDVAFKVVGIGSVGTFCAIGLFVSADGQPLLLQVKQAMASVLAPHAGASAYPQHGQRVVTGQRIMQTVNDLFLGWSRVGADGREFYIRRVKDARLADLGTMIEEHALRFTARLQGRTLARAHARSGDCAMLAGYLGEGEAFDDAIAGFADRYAGQTERDWHDFTAAIAAGRLEAHEP